MKALVLVAIALRIGLLFYGSWQDANFAVKYTDIDYEVYTDAAGFLVAGQSPYLRSTYRYSPLLAALLAPNILFHKSFGKILFSIADIVAALFMQRILQDKKKVSSQHIAVATALWLFSPFTVSISTRGNGEALVTVMLLAMFYLLDRGFIVSSGILFGLAVHWRIYPIFYALPILRHLALLENSTPKKTNKRKNLLKALWKSIFSISGLIFGLVSAAVFLGLGVGLYKLYGQEFLNETYLYHARRIDPRHNFSPYFLPAYLGTEEENSSFIGDSGRAFTVVALLLQLILGWSFADNLQAAFLLQTNRLLISASVWAASLAHWLAWAYQLEFKGQAVHVQVWLAGLVWVASNAALLRELIVGLKSSPSSSSKQTNSTRITTRNGKKKR